MAKLTHEERMEMEMKRVYDNSAYPDDGVSYEEFKKFYCPNCTRENCIHRDCYRRVPERARGLGLCPNLKAR